MDFATEKRSLYALGDGMSLALDWWKTRGGEDPMRYLDDVFRYALARLGQREDAEDVAIEVVQALPNPCRRAELRAYMIGMARRKVVDRLRRRKTSATVRDTDATICFAGRSEDAAMVGNVLEKLSEDHREVLIMKYVIGLSSGEIGQLTGRKASAVDSILQRARDSFAGHWQLLSSDEVKP